MREATQTDGGGGGGGEERQRRWQWLRMGQYRSGNKGGGSGDENEVVMEVGGDNGRRRSRC